jgi:hypothetical protein
MTKNQNKQYFLEQISIFFNRFVKKTAAKITTIPTVGDACNMIKI